MKTLFATWKVAAAFPPETRRDVSFASHQAAGDSEMLDAILGEYPDRNMTAKEIEAKAKGVRYAMQRVAEYKSEHPDL